GAVGDAEDMGIHRHGELSKRRVEYHVGGLAADAGQGFKVFAVVRDLTAVLLDQDAAGLDDVLRLASVQADGLDVLRQPLDAQRIDRFRRVGDRVQLGGGLVDADIGGLRREDHCNQQLEWSVVGQLCLGLGVVLMEATKYLPTFFRIHGYSITPVTRTRRLCTGASGCSALARSASCSSMRFFRAINRPSTINAPGGRIASRKPL